MLLSSSLLEHTSPVVNLPRSFPCAPGIPPFINGLFDSPRAGYVILLAGMALGFLAERSQDDEWDEEGTDSGLLLCGTGESAVLTVFRGGLQEEPSYESWKDATTEQILQD